MQKLTTTNNLRVGQHCKPELAMLAAIQGNSITDALSSYLDLAIRLLCELGDARHELSLRTQYAKSAFNLSRLLIENKNTMNWVLARNLFGCGRTEAIKFCKELNINPDGNTW